MINQELETNHTANLILSIGNSGEQTLNYTISKPADATLVLNESFENGGMIPSDWTEEHVIGTNPWVFDAGGNASHPDRAFDGRDNALLHSSLSSHSTKLVTPSLDLSGVASGSLTFWHTQEQYSANQDELNVYYRSTSKGNWILLASYTANVTTWTKETIDLPNLSSSYYIAFEGITNSGYGVCIDLAQVTAHTDNSDNWLTLDNGVAVCDSVPAGQPNQLVTIGFNSTGLIIGTYSSYIYLTSNNSENTNIQIPIRLTVSADSLVLNTPENLHLIFQNDNLELSWDAVPNATAYRIYEADSPTGIWSLNTTTTNHVFLQPKASLGSSKFYKVVAIHLPQFVKLGRSGN